MDQETSEEGLFIKAEQIARHLWTDSSIAARQIAIYRDLMNEVRQIYEIQFFRSDFRPMLMYLGKVSFLTTLDLYKAYFRGRYIKEYKENLCKRWPMPYSL